MKASTRWLLVIAASLCGIGVLLCGISLALSGFDFFKATSAIDYKEKAMSYDAALFDSIQLSAEDQKIVIRPSSDGQVHISYWESDNDIYEVSTEGGVLDFRHKTKTKWYDSFFYGWFSGLTKQMTQGIQVSLPGDYAGRLSASDRNAALDMDGFSSLAGCSLSTTNGSIRANNVTAWEWTAKTTNSSIHASRVSAGRVEAASTNGRISLEEVRSAGELTVKTTNAGISFDRVEADVVSAATSNGSVNLGEITAAASLRAGTTNSSVKADRLHCPDITLTSTNGSIKGKVAALRDQYRIAASTTNGSNSLENQTGDLPYRLTAQTTNGSINLEFTGEPLSAQAPVLDLPAQP